MVVYALYDGCQPVCAVEISHRDWMPVKPRISGAWLHFFVTEALRRYFSAACVVKA